MQKIRARAFAILETFKKHFIAVPRNFQDEYTPSNVNQSRFGRQLKMLKIRFNPSMSEHQKVLNQAKQQGQLTGNGYHPKILSPAEIDERFFAFRMPYPRELQMYLHLPQAERDKIKYVPEMPSSDPEIAKMQEENLLKRRAAMKKILGGLSLFVELHARLGKSDEEIGEALKSFSLKRLKNLKDDNKTNEEEEKTFELVRMKAGLPKKELQFLDRDEDVFDIEQ